MLSDLPDNSLPPTGQKIANSIYNSGAEVTCNQLSFEGHVTDSLEGFGEFEENHQKAGSLVNIVTYLFHGFNSNLALEQGWSGEK